jgi:hypothetical protein
MKKAGAISTRNQFSAGGNMKPIVTKYGNQNDSGVQQMGNSVGTTKLGAYRMGDSDGNAPPSANYPGDIFGPIRMPERKDADVMFASVGNRVFQPDLKDTALQALIRKVGDQKFKAEEYQKFDEYFQTQKAVMDLDAVSRYAGLEELTQTRGIIRSLVDARRKQTEDDYMRRMLDSGMTGEDAQNEIDNVRRASALQEAKTADDRPYQSKLLIQRLANSRGSGAIVNEPFTHSQAIENPMPSQAVGGLSGQVGFAQSPLDINKQFFTPEYYKRFLRRTNLTNEVADQMTVLSGLGAAGQPVVTGPMKDAMEREQSIENKRDAVAARLEVLRSGRLRINLPLAEIHFADDVLAPVYRRKGKKPKDTARFGKESVQDLTNFGSVVSINQTLSQDASGNALAKLQGYLRQPTHKYKNDDGTPSAKAGEVLKGAAKFIASEDVVFIPFIGDNYEIPNTLIMKAFDKVLNLSPEEISQMVSQAAEYSDLITVDMSSIVPAEGETVRLGPRMATGRSAVPNVVGGSNAAAGVSADSAPIVAQPVVEARANEPSFTKAMISAELTRLGVVHSKSRSRTDLYNLYVTNFQ